MSEVLWIEGNPAPPLAIVLCPRGGSELEDNLLRIRQSGVETLVSLLEEEEAAWLGLAQEGPLANHIGLTFLSYPIPDVHVPQNAATFRNFVAGLAERLRTGERLGVHCRGSVGRAPLTAACTLIHLGWEPEDALQAIEKARGLAIPDTEEQRRWILRYKAEL
jgi:protein-tyrosine phosphatase